MVGLSGPFLRLAGPALGRFRDPRSGAGGADPALFCEPSGAEADTERAPNGGTEMWEGEKGPS